MQRQDNKTQRTKKTDSMGIAQNGITRPNPPHARRNPLNIIKINKVRNEHDGKGRPEKGTVFRT